MAQFPLYAWHGTWPQALWLGARASITDGAFVLLIYAGGVIAFRRRDWYVRPGAGGYALTILVGATWAAAVELSALKNGRWSYGPFMPQLEWLGGVGVLPIVQMIVLPPLIFRVVARRDTR